MALIDVLAGLCRATPPFRGKGSIARVLHARLGAGAIRRAPVREITMRDGSRARWDLRDVAEARAWWLGTADDAVRDLLLGRIPRDATVLDVGANVGWWTVPMARRLMPGGGRVVAFEPVPANRARLEWALAANGVASCVTVAPVALGEEAGEVAMWFKGAETGAGSGTAALVTDGGESHLEVPVVTLDQWAIEHDLTRCDLMKLDIEGAELMMLRGAESFIARHRPLIFGEFEAYWLSTFGSSFVDVAAWAERMGYGIRKWDARRNAFTPLHRAEAGVQDVLLEPRV